MGFRFRRSFKIAPGLRLNTSLSGFSLSAGVRGAGVNIGRRGLTSHVGIPGTGVSFQSSGGRGRGAPRASLSGVEQLASISVLLEDDGDVRLTLADGTPLTLAQVKSIRAQQGERIAEILDRACVRWNQGIDELLTVHEGTPAADYVAAFQEEPFPEEQPAAPRLRPVGLLGRMFGNRRERIEEANRQAARTHQDQLGAWSGRASEHRQAQAQLRWVSEVGRYQDTQAMHQYLERALSAIEWPRETAVSAGIEAAGPCGVARRGSARDRSHAHAQCSGGHARAEGEHQGEA